MTYSISRHEWFWRRGKKKGRKAHSSLPFHPRSVGKEKGKKGNREVLISYPGEPELVRRGGERGKGVVLSSTSTTASSDAIGRRGKRIGGEILLFVSHKTRRKGND